MHVEWVDMDGWFPSLYLQNMIWLKYIILPNQSFDSLLSRIVRKVRKIKEKTRLQFYLTKTNEINKIAIKSKKRQKSQQKKKTEAALKFF